MIDLEIKINKIEKNCIEFAKKETKALKDENDLIVSERKADIIDNYKDELAKKYLQDIDNLKKEYNMNVFNYEVQERKKITDYKQNLLNQIKAEVEKFLKEFAKSRSYKKFLFSSISNVFVAEEISEDATIYITDSDFLKYKNEIIKKYNLKVDKIDNNNIGGFKLIDLKNKFSIDNTLKNNIEEQISKINF